jgi:hypothetical protein
MRFVNNTGANEVAWVTVGNSTAPGTCGNLGVGWVLTPCSPVTLPFVDGFEGPATPIFPDCWSIANAGSGTALWENYSTTPRTGVRCASIIGVVAPGNDDWLFTPGLQMTGGITYAVEFWWRAASNTANDSVEVKAGTSNTPAGMTTTIIAPDTFHTIAYIQESAAFTPPSDGVYYVGWRSTTKTSSGRVRVDDVNIYASGTCSPPDSVRVPATVGQDSVTLSATVYGGTGGPTQYKWYHGTDCILDSLIAGATNSTYVAHASGIYSCKGYKVNDTTCAACDSAYATVIDCSIPASLPLSEGFESTSGTAMPTCWTVTTYDADAIRWVTSTTNPRTGLRCAYIQYSASGVIPNDWTFTPPFTLTQGSSYVLDFWWRQYLTSSTYYDSLEVLLTSAPNNSSTVGVIVPIFRANVTTYQNSISIFAPPVTGNYHVAFRYTGSANAGGIRVDDISLILAGSCTAPAVSVADSSAIGTVTMFCLATGGSGGPLSYQWYTGQTCTPGNEIAGATTNTYLTTVSGDFACLAWRYDSLLCSACEWGHATVTPAPPGYDCSSPIFLAGVRDSATHSNCGMGHNNPGQSCGVSNNDKVFAMIVPNGIQATIWQSSNNFDSRHSMKWGGCNLNQGTLIGCVSDPDTLRLSWINCTGVEQTVYFIVGTYSTSATPQCSTLVLQWSLDTPTFCPDIACTPTVTESGGNGGCGVDSLFNTISCNDVIAGTIQATLTTRDVDAFELTLANPQNLIITALSEFDAVMEVRRDTVAGCPDFLVTTINDLGNCAGESRTLYSVPAGIVHISITTPFTETCGPRDYCLTVTCAPPTSEPGEDCANPYILTPPTPGNPSIGSGTTVGRNLTCRDSCNSTIARSSSPDVFYSLTLAECRRITMSLDDGTGAGDMYIAVYAGAENCCLNTILCNDDNSASDTIWWETTGQRYGGVTSFVGGELTAGTYLIRVGRWSTGTGNYRLKVYDNGPCPCAIPCQGGDQIEVAENRYSPTFKTTDPDGGCNNSTPTFGATSCTVPLCGVGFNYLNPGTGIIRDYFRDTDWHLFTTIDERIVSLTVNSEFPAEMGVVDTNGCVSPIVLFGSTVPACAPTTVSDTLPAGTYAVFVAPVYFIGNPMPMHYRATLTCAVPCVPDTVHDVAIRLVNNDGDPAANDIALRWTADSAFAATYSVWSNIVDEPYPGGGWTALASGIAPVLGPDATIYIHDDGSVAQAKRYYLVFGVCP